MSWDVEGLPEGMYFEKDEENPLRILLKGIPHSAGEYPVRVLLSKNIGTANSPNIFTDSRDYTLNIIDNQPASFTAIGSFPQYFNKGTFSYNVIPLLGTPPLSVSYRGTLPDGLSFNKYTNSFILSGVAEKTGTFSINITVSNDTGIASKDVTITVLDPAVITTYYLPDGLKGEKYHAALSTLYDVPATWTVKGPLPGGLTFSASRS